MSTTLHSRGHFIAGDEVPAASGATFESLDPTNGEPIATLARGSAEDVDRAVAAARAAFPAWRDVDPYARGRILQRLADLVEAHADDLAEVESRDAGKPHGDAVREVDRVVRTFTYYAGWPTKITGTTNPADPGVFSYTLREPVGVVGAITPWNFPAVIAAWKLAPALACGNAVVHKPAEESPLSALLLAELAREAGIPPGVWNVVTGDAEAGAALVAHDDVDKVSFTGSTAVGREIQRSAAGNLKRLTLELGGKSANVVLDDADLDAAVEGAMRATFRNQGQVCTAGARLVAHASLADELAERVAERVRGLEPGPLISARQREHVLELYGAATDEGARALVGGGALDRPGFFVEPTVFVDTTNEMRINREEIFGPAVAVIRAGDAEEAVRIANDTPYGLAAAVWTRDASRAHLIARALNAGTVWINNYGGLDVYSAYGGRGLSGYGYEQGPQTIEEYTTLKTVRQTL
ncbi:MAG TPA: aldehyde dehydrogenase family protein [Gaiellaceae bacterium]|nr:aldehyde dehydrogenase family protein [Gaiellaceae bacterium]